MRETLANRHILLIGVTGFIGKVWLVDLLENIPKIGKITLLIRRNRTTSAQRRFQKIVEESPTFDTLQEKHGRKLGTLLERESRSCRRRREFAGAGFGRGDAGAIGKIARFGGEQRGADGFQSGFARRAFFQRGFDVAPAGFFAEVRPCRVDASFDLLCGGHARRARDGRVAGQLQSCARSGI